MTAENGQTDPTAAAPPERLRVLLVDDNASVLRFLASAFSSNHCQVTTAGTAEQALEQLGDDPFHLVVSDIKMPGLSGLDLLRAVKGKQPGTPVVLITGDPAVQTCDFGRVCGTRARRTPAARLKMRIVRTRACVALIFGYVDENHLGNSTCQNDNRLASRHATRFQGVMTAMTPSGWRSDRRGRDRMPRGNPRQESEDLRRA